MATGGVTPLQPLHLKGNRMYRIYQIDQVTGAEYEIYRDTNFALVKMKILSYIMEGKCIKMTKGN